MLRIHKVGAWCEEPSREIGYGSSADMSLSLHTELMRLPKTAWELERVEAEVIREWAEVTYVHDDGDHRNDRP
jgi:hypothetical protein